ncbi:Hypothetical protein HVR_LOCUS567 [uncultured virus]|nr:Hypothetical protein HVR_LOCUS567 [uncultured virus]
MDTVECHILKYPTININIIYYNHRGTAVALAVRMHNNNTLWYHLVPNVNQISSDINITWPLSHFEDETLGKAVCGFIVENNGQVINDNYYNHRTFSETNLVKVPTSKGYFVPEYVSQEFKVFVGINEFPTTRALTDSATNKTLSMTQWILCVGIFIIAVVLFWLLTSKRNPLIK